LISLKNDQKLIKTVGKKAIGDFLLKLQVFKSMGDIESAQKLFDKYSEVSDSLEYPYLKYRDIVIARKKPRKLFVESSTNLVNGKLELKSYEATHEGLIQSFNDHFNQEPDIDQIIVDLWKKDVNHFV
jgi:dipeptidyl-peptidase-3